MLLAGRSCARRLPVLGALSLHVSIGRHVIGMCADLYLLICAEILALSRAPIGPEERTDLHSNPVQMGQNSRTELSARIDPFGGESKLCSCGAGGSLRMVASSRADVCLQSYLNDHLCQLEVCNALSMVYTILQQVSC